MKIEKIWLSDDAVWVRRDDGAEVSESFLITPDLSLPLLNREPVS